MKSIALIWPKSTFLSRADIWPPLGLWYLSSRLKSMGYSTQFFDLNFDEMPEKNDFDYLFVGGTSPQIREVKRIAEITKNWKSKRILGGAGAWASPQAHKNLGYDLVVGGEADEPKNMQHILDNIESNPDGRYIQLPMPKTLEWVLPPDRTWTTKYFAHMNDILDGETIRLATSYNTRGCVFNCSFCEVGRSGVIMGNRVRYEPIEIIEEQFKEIHRLGFNGVAFYDDVADFDKKKTLARVELLRKYKLKFRCFMRSDIIIKHGGREYLKLLRDGGLFEIFVGIESADNKIKDAIHKDTTIEQDEEVLSWCRELGIRFKGSFILGLPSESMESMNKTRDWIMKQNPDGIRIQVGRLIPFAGTPLGDHPEQFDINYERMPDDDWFYSGETGLDMKSFVSTSYLTREEIDNFWRKLLGEMKDAGFKS